jgi:type III secretory pathway component EscT
MKGLIKLLVFMSLAFTLASCQPTEINFTINWLNIIKVAGLFIGGILIGFGIGFYIFRDFKPYGK